MLLPVQSFILGIESKMLSVSDGGTYLRTEGLTKAVNYKNSFSV